MELIQFFFQILPSTFALHTIILSLILMKALHRQSHFPLRACAALVAGPLTEKFLLRSMEALSENVFQSQLRILIFYLIFFMNMVIFRLLCRITWKEALFGAAASYALQHSGYLASTIAIGTLHLGQEYSYAMEFPFFLAVVLAAWFYLADHLAIQGRYPVSWKESIGMTTLLLLFGFHFSMLTSLFYGESAQGLGEGGLYILCRLYGLLCCLFVLMTFAHYKKRAQVVAANAAQAAILDEQKKQYRISREMFRTINAKCHDLKLQMGELRRQRETVTDKRLAELERAVVIYDTSADTGCEALNVLLTEIGLACEQMHITWTCMADARGLSYVSNADLYTIGSIMLHHAIDQVRKLPQEKRIITFGSMQKTGIVNLQVEYYANAENPSDHQAIAAMDGRLQEDISALRGIAQQYGGDAAFQHAGSASIISVMLPRKTVTEKKTA